MQNIAVNKKAKHDYFINEKYEAGLVLTGTEVKSLRQNTGSIKESYIIENKGELWLMNCYIKKISSSNEINYDPLKKRKILVKKKEKDKIIGLSNKDGNSIIPLILYFNSRGFVKISIGLGKGKKKLDKRNSIKAKEWNIKQQRLVKSKLLKK